MARRSDRFVCFLGILDLGRIGSIRWIEKCIPVLRTNEFSGRVNRFFRKGGGVGTHVGDIAIFVQALGGSHGVLCGHPQFAVRLLLHGARSKWRLGAFGIGLHFYVEDPERDSLQTLFERFCGFRIELEKFRIFEQTGRRIEILSGRDATVVHAY